MASGKTEHFDSNTPPLTALELSPRWTRKVKKKAIHIQASAILGDKVFTPSAFQLQFTQIYLQVIAGGQIPRPTTILKEMGRNTANFYIWSKNPKFMKWFLACKEEFHASRGLAEVHTATYTHALKESPADRKLYLERFDEKYKPTVKQQISFVGSRPDDDMDEEQIREQSRKYVESASV